MLSKTVSSISRSTSEMINVSVDMVRGLTWGEVRDLVRFARRRLREEMLPQVAGSLTFTTTLALVPLLTIVLAIFTTFPIFGSCRTRSTIFRADGDAEGDFQHDHLEPDPVRQQGHGLSAVGAVALVFTTTAMMGMIERAFNQIWRVRAPAAAGAAGADLLGPGHARAAAVRPSLTLTSQLFSATTGLMSAIAAARHAVLRRWCRWR
jgi:membrane protein